MKIHVSCQGDPSVGIPGDSTTLEMEDRLCFKSERDNRYWLRRELILLFTELFDEKANVVFDDECYDCHQLLTECKCENEVP